eukprot:Blabericola_migrator_1__7572@NODE_386_length_9117_cov_178_340884_g309_i0_p4_GENE_NODE_386_length_9117_cov_178_340884_g309_i0NODE_386_length_9117_cov_178_340884_g309_i0_p4_ORF_typecomplete_len229_score34_53zfCDGSH/PF09360_10/0_15_NODE_386_length_9117_cov_178_340884_g309_i031923878
MAKTTFYSRSFDPTLEPARLAYALAGYEVEEVELDQEEDKDIEIPLLLRSPTHQLPFAATGGMTIGGPTAILYHGASEARLMPEFDDPSRLLQATMVSEVVHGILLDVRQLQRRPFQPVDSVDEHKDKIVTSVVPEQLQLLERLTHVPSGPLTLGQLDVGHIAVAALHYLLVELIDFCSPEDYANMYPNTNQIAHQVAALAEIQKCWEPRHKRLVEGGVTALCRCGGE